MNNDISFQKSSNYVNFFLGIESKNSYISYFNELQNPFNSRKTFLLKGDCAVKQSNFIDTLYSSVPYHQDIVEKIHCSLSPNKLDGLVANALKVSYINSTSPHNISENNPCIVEDSIDLYSAYDKENIFLHRESILDTKFIINAYKEKFCKALDVANSLFEENSKLILPHVHIEKLKKDALKFAKKEIPTFENSLGELRSRFLTSFTSLGILTYASTISKMCQRIYLLIDDYDCCSNIFLQQIKDFALQQGHICYCCYSPLNPQTKIDHILIPELGLAFVTKNYLCDLKSITPFKVINCQNFIDKSILRDKRQHISFNLKTGSSILNEAINFRKKQAETFNILQEYYIPHIDFRKVESICDRQCFELKKMFTTL